MVGIFPNNVNKIFFHERSELVFRVVCKLIDKAFTDDELLKAKFPTAKSAIQVDSYSLVIHVTVRAGNDCRYAIVATKAKTELSYSPIESFQTGF